MPSVLILEPAQNDLVRLEYFLAEKDHDAAERMKKAMANALSRLEESPNIGSPFRKIFKRLLVRFGKSKYVLVYKYVKTDNMVYVLAVWHGREDPSHPQHGQ
ncbi:MAG: type II toxin-antitoxin system RelE/ParE family toxin [Candidatus Adiutrix sp.]|jgi:plasmid stabilization system protein ParE|nr:type II toxin-antitoxin system RelE/ParE family toxin [Candidatus Adiutrix sp.]